MSDPVADSYTRVDARGPIYPVFTRGGSFSRTRAVDENLPFGAPPPLVEMQPPNAPSAASHAFAAETAAVMRRDTAVLRSPVSRRENAVRPTRDVVSFDGEPGSVGEVSFSRNFLNANANSASPTLPRQTRTRSSDAVTPTREFSASSLILQPQVTPTDATPRARTMSPSRTTCETMRRSSRRIRSSDRGYARGRATHRRHERSRQRSERSSPSTSSNSSISSYSSRTASRKVTSRKDVVGRGTRSTENLSEESLRRKQNRPARRRTLFAAGSSAKVASVSDADDDAPLDTRLKRRASRRHSNKLTRGIVDGGVMPPTWHERMTTLGRDIERHYRRTKNKMSELSVRGIDRTLRRVARVALQVKDCEGSEWNSQLVRLMRDAYFHKTELLYQLVTRLNTSVITHAELCRLLSPGFTRDPTERLFTVITESTMLRCYSCAVRHFVAIDRAQRRGARFILPVETKLRLRQLLDTLAYEALQRAQLRREQHGRRVFAMDITLDSYMPNRVGEQLSTRNRTREREIERGERAARREPRDTSDEYPISRPNFLAGCQPHEKDGSGARRRHEKLLREKELPYTQGALAKLLVLTNSRNVFDGKAALNALNAYVFNSWLNIVVAAMEIATNARRKVLDPRYLEEGEKRTARTTIVQSLNSTGETVASVITFEQLWKRSGRVLRALHQEINEALVKRAVVL